MVGWSDVFEQNLRKKMGLPYIHGLKKINLKFPFQVKAKKAAMAAAAAAKK